MCVKRKRRKTEQMPPQGYQRIPVIYADPRAGLTSEQAHLRAENGLRNVSVDPPVRTVYQIIRDNVLTYFNLVFSILATAVILVGEFRELTFMVVVIINTIIGIVQELRSKSTLDKLTLLSAPRSRVVRDGVVTEIETDQLVRDDIVIFSAGMQICADAVVVSGGAQLNEALITGEPDEIAKNVGSELLSGSFVVSGRCRARLTKVGAESYVSRLTVEAKKGKKPKQSEMMRSLTRLVQVIGILLIPMGALLFINQYNSLELSITQSVVSTVAALIGMIPEGLYLLTTLALTVSVMRLAKRKTLVHDLGCIETLARVDVLCVDKTGTITEDKMIMKGTELLTPDRFNDEDVIRIMTDFAAAQAGDNSTMIAIKAHYSGIALQAPIKTLPFSSARKYSGVSFDPEETYLLGAPEFVLGDEYEKHKVTIEPFSAQGYRVLLLAMSDGIPEAGENPKGPVPIALLLLYNKIRSEAPEAFRYFAKQGVTIKVISGDHPITVSEVAKRAGIENAEKYVDAKTLDTDEKLMAAADEFTVFGRVTPLQKRVLVRALKSKGHTVAMTGDGVNDVLALKDADCGIAMASGSDVSARVSHLVLLDSNFGALPSVVMEGRRVINNIERSASLFLVKNTFSFLLALTAIIFVLPYPIRPTQISLLSALTIGIPTFVLALEPNKSRVSGHFLSNVLKRALPGGLTNYFLVLLAVCYCGAFGIPSTELGTISIIIMLVVGLIMLYRVSVPFNALRKALFGFIIVATIFSLSQLGGFFDLVMPGTQGILLLVLFLLLAKPANSFFTKGLDIAIVKFSEFIKKRDEFILRRRRAGKRS